MTTAGANPVDCNLVHVGRSSDPVIPAEVLKMDTRSLQMYKEALQNGKEKVHHIRVMVVGPRGVGKTTLIKHLLGKDVDISETRSTEGIDLHTDCCKVSLTTGEWTTQEENAEQYFRLQHVQTILNEHVQKQEASAKQKVKSKMDKSTSAKQDIDREVKPISSQPVDLSFVKVEISHDVEHSDPETSNIAIPVSEAESGKSEKKMDTLMELCQLVSENADKLEKSIEKYAPLAMLDFAGQQAFYTTHQTFLTSHAIYLLVADLNQLVTDLIKDDERFLDTDGIKQSTVHDPVGIWLDSIHSCAPSPDAGIPPVILVGTHVDKIPEKSQQKVIDKCFIKLRYMLREKPSICHLVDEIAIDNTKLDPMLEQLKKKMFELASRQPHWGKEKPARWLPLEQAIMNLKASGVKVVPLSLVEEIDRSGSVRIDDRHELDLFLRFQHDIGTILYFSVEELQERIVLDPPWLIDALKSLKAADEVFIKENPAIIDKWYEFKDKGILTLELIDVLWTKETNPEFHDNKEHILQLLEHLNIIFKPRVYTEDTVETKVENYFFVPCMLRETTPEEIICPKPHSDIENSSVLCYVFVGKFMPVPIFHRLLAACVVRWPIAKEKSENLIYCGGSVFDLDSHHKLTVFFREYVIFARVSRLGIREKTPSSRLCIEVREFITMTLSKVNRYLGQSLKFELFIECPKSEGDNVDCLIPVALLKAFVDVPCHLHDRSHLVMSHDVLKFWFQEEVSEGEEEEATGGEH